MKKTQEDWVKNQLRENGKISRNFCLQNYVSRLGAIIFIIKEQGWDINGHWVKTEHGKDFVYTLVNRPTKKVSRFEIVDNVAKEYWDEVPV
jgi:hypothetical protein